MRGEKMISDKKKVAILEQYVDRESTGVDFGQEIQFYTNVKQGNKEAIQEMVNKHLFLTNNQYKLSENPLQSLKYHLAISAAMIARFCIEGGMEYKHAYTISDGYIQKADKATSEKEILNIYEKMCMDYTRQMDGIRKQSIYSKPIAKSVDYIYSHLHCRITVEEVAEKIGLNENYFSRLFHKEIGLPFGHYILLKKLEVAQNMLKYSDYSCSEISELLSFSSQSHFISKFKAEYGMTPLRYRNLYYNDLGIEEKF